MDLATKITKLLGNRPLTDLADAVGASRGSFNNYVNRGSMPRADVALRISRELDVPFDWLVDDDQDWPPPPRDQAQLSLADTHTGELTYELQKRACRELLDLHAEYQQFLIIDWKPVVEAAFTALLSGNLDPDEKALCRRAAMFMPRTEEIQSKFDAYVLPEELQPDDWAGYEPWPFVMDWLFNLQRCDGFTWAGSFLFTRMQWQHQQSRDEAKNRAEAALEWAKKTSRSVPGEEIGDEQEQIVAGKLSQKPRDVGVTLAAKPAPDPNKTAARPKRRNP
ncbi:MAG: helix-turn-helix transcriptional regulator [Planctomycetota bacterium]